VNEAIIVDVRETVVLWSINDVREVTAAECLGYSV